MPESPPTSITPEPMPRRLTGRAKRQSWLEPSVRAWWLLLALMVAATGYLIIEQLLITRSVRHRLVDWKHQVVLIDKISYSRRKTFRVEPEYLAVDMINMSYTDEHGQRQELAGHLTGQRQARSPGDKIEVLLNPANLSEYSDRVIPTPLGEQLIIPAILAPFTILFLLAALIKRHGILKLWREGDRHEAEVVDVAKSAISPRSSVVKVMIPRSRTRRLFRLAIPRSKLNPQPGDTFSVITPKGEPTRAIAAMLYE